LGLGALGDSPAAKVLRDRQNRVHAIALVHDLLHASTEQARVDLRERLAALTSQEPASVSASSCWRR